MGQSPVQMHTALIPTISAACKDCHLPCHKLWHHYTYTLLLTLV